MDAERLKQIRERAEKATPGPWVAAHRCGGMSTDRDESCGLGLDVEGPPEPMNRGQFARGADAEFIANARQDVPDLLSELERLDAVIYALHMRTTTGACVCVSCERLRISCLEKAKAKAGKPTA